MEQENKGRKVADHKFNERKGAANISQDEHGSKEEKSSHNHRSLDEVDAKGEWSVPDGESNGVQSDKGYKTNESESNRDEDEGVEISDKEEWMEENERDWNIGGGSNDNKAATTQGKNVGDIWYHEEEYDEG